MATLGETARDYKSTQTKNIADLDKVSVKLELEDDSFDVMENGQTKTVNQKVIVVDEVKHRIPVSVLQQLKVLIEDNPQLEFFKVKKTGEGKDATRYTVIPVTS